MRRTPIGARKFVRRSGIPNSAWANRLGICASNFFVLMRGDSRMQKGPAMERLITLLDALDRKEWEWVREGPVRKAASWTWRGEAAAFSAPRPMLKVNVLEGRLSWQ